MSYDNHYIYNLKLCNLINKKITNNKSYSNKIYQFKLTKKILKI